MMTRKPSRTEIKEFVMWNKMLYNIGGKWVWEPVVFSIFTASLVTQSLYTNAWVFYWVLVIRWFVGTIDYGWNLTQIETELGIRKLTPYLDNKLKQILDDIAKILPKLEKIVNERGVSNDRKTLGN